MLKEEQIRQILLEQDPEFRQLMEEHQKLEARLSELLKKWYLTAEEEEEERTLKRRKLMIKDRMYAMIAAFQRERK